MHLSFGYIYIKNKLKEPPIDKISFMVQDIAYAYKIFKILYIANHSRRKTFAINRIELQFAGNFCSWMLVLHSQSILYRLFYWKVLQSPINPRNFSTVNDLQYTLCQTNP